MLLTSSLEAGGAERQVVELVKSLDPAHWSPFVCSLSPLVPLARFLYSVTEPVLAPLRRVIPPIGGFDISFIVLFFAIQIIQRSVLRCGSTFL